MGFRGFFNLVFLRWEFLGVFVPSLTAQVGYWAMLALNIPDFPGGLR